MVDMLLSHRSSNCFGVIIVLTIALATGCDSSQTGTISIQKPTDAKADQDQASGIAETIRGQADLNTTPRESELIPESVDELMMFLARKGTEQLRPGGPNRAYEIQKQRAAASQKLLTLRVRGEQRVEVVRIRLDSLLKLIGFGDPQAQHDFQKLISKFRNDGQPGIREAIAIAGLINDCRQQVSVDDTDLQTVIDGAAKVAAEYPDSFNVCKEIGNLGQQLRQEGYRRSWLKISRILIETYQDSANLTARNYVSRLGAQTRVASAKLDLIINDIQEQKAGSLDRFRNAVTWLFSDQNVDLTSIQPIIASLTRLENTGKTVEALQANQIVTNAAQEISNQQARDQLQLNCTRRETRLGMIGRPFNINGISMRGQQFDWVTYSAGRPVVVVFWSPAEPASVKMVQRLATLFESHKTQGLQLLAVNTSIDSGVSSLFGTELPEWEIVKGDPALGENEYDFVERFGLVGVPQIVLVDREGSVVCVNPREDDLHVLVGQLVQP